jgi:hypothetical protein
MIILILEAINIDMMRIFYHNNLRNEHPYNMLINRIRNIALIRDSKHRADQLPNEPPRLLRYFLYIIILPRNQHSLR